MRSVSRLLIAIGCGLLAISLVQVILDRRPAVDSASSASSAVEVRARWSGIAPAGQSTGFAVATDGSLAVVDRGRQRVVRLTPSGGPLAEWGPGFGSGVDAKDLSGIAAAPDGGWYVLDRGELLILKLDASGQAVSSIDLQPLATYGPNGLAVSAQGDVYLADTGGNRILVFSPAGALSRSIGTPGAGAGQLKQPLALSFGPDGAMYVSDFENNRIERWDATLQDTNVWSVSGHAWGVGVDRLNRVFVPDADRDLVRMFSPQGDLLAEIGGRPDAGLLVAAPIQVGLSPDGSALWVLGSDGLARVDLSAYSQVVPTARGMGVPLPVGILGAVLVAAGLAPRARRAISSADTRSLAPPGVQAPPPSRTGRGGTVLGERGGAEPSESRRAGWGLDLIFGMAMFGSGLLGAVVAQVTLAGPTGKTDPWPWLAALVSSGLVWAAGCALSARTLPIGWVASWPNSPDSLRTLNPLEHSPSLRLTRGRAVAAGAACLAACIAASLWWVGHFETADATRAMLVWLLAVALAALTCSRLPPPTILRWRPTPLTLIPLLLFVLAFGPRVWQVADLPYGLWYDEAQGALEIRRVVHQGTYTPILSTYGRDTSGFFYLVSGLSLASGDTTLAPRLAAALVGALTASATYLFGRELFGWRAGLAAGVLLAFSRWHLNFSRLGFNPISLPLCATVAFWLLARAVRRKRWSDVVWAGLALGAGMHAYTGFRGMPLVAVVAVGLAAAAYRWSPAALVTRFGVYMAAAGLTALPVLVFAAQDPGAFNGRTAQTLILTQPVSDAEKLRQIWDTLQRHALMFNVSGDMNGRHNLPGAPMLDPLTAILVVLGLGWLLMRPRDWRTWLLLAWSAVAMSGGVLTLAFEAPQAVRTIAITPVLAVLGGLGLVALLDRLAAVARISRATHAWPAGAIVAGLGALALAWIGFTSLDTYFNQQMPNAAVFAAFSTRETVPARAALDWAGGDTSILASTTMIPSVQADYLVPDRQSSIRPFDPTGDLPFRGPGTGLVFLETEHDQALIDEVARLYPDAVRHSVRPPAGGKSIVEGFELDPAVLAAHRGLQATYRGADGAILARSETRPEPLPAGDGSPPALLPGDAGSPPVALPASVRWQGGLALEVTGEYSFRIPPGFALRLDDALLASAPGSGVRVRLVRGNHSLVMAGTLATDGTQARLEWRTPSNLDWQPVPAEALFMLPSGGTGLQLALAAGLDSAAQPTEEYVDPVVSHYFHVNPLSRLHLDPQVWSAEWTGEIETAIGGPYAFSLDYSQAAGVWIDDQPILGNLGAADDAHNALLDLAAGRHTLRVRYAKTTDGSPSISLYWTPPGKPPAVIPGSALYPPPPAVLGAAE